MTEGGGGSRARGDMPRAQGRARRGLWRGFVRQPGAVAGGLVFLWIVFAVLLGPSVYGVDPGAIDLAAKHQGASWDHPMGTDQLGRDVMAQVLVGGRISLSVGLAAMSLSLGIGALIGILAGYFRRLDGPLMRLCDLFLALPLLPLLLVAIMLFRDTLRATLGPEAGIFVLVVGLIGLTSWMQTARILRAEVLALKERDFIRAARGLGAQEGRILRRHILPNVMIALLVSATLGVASAILTESALSFLGLGFASDFPTWGRLVFDGLNFLDSHPGRVIWPGLAISVSVLSVTYIADGLRTALDPRQRRA